jgi:hypothetical protein
MITCFRDVVNIKDSIEMRWIFRTLPVRLDCWGY